MLGLLLPLNLLLGCSLPLLFVLSRTLLLLDLLLVLGLLLPLYLLLTLGSASLLPLLTLGCILLLPLLFALGCTLLLLLDLLLMLGLPLRLLLFALGCTLLLLLDLLLMPGLLLPLQLLLLLILDRRWPATVFATCGGPGWSTMLERRCRVLAILRSGDCLLPCLPLLSGRWRRSHRRRAVTRTVMVILALQRLLLLYPRIPFA